jgi:hypothetical protein
MNIGVTYEMRLLLALRAGNASTDALVARFGVNSSMALGKLRRKGFVQDLLGGEVAITPLGREHCPTRRENKVVS